MGDLNTDQFFCSNAQTQGNHPGSKKGKFFIPGLLLLVKRTQRMIKSPYHRQTCNVKLPSFAIFQSCSSMGLTYDPGAPVAYGMGLGACLLACKQAPYESGKKIRRAKCESGSEASGSRSVNPRAKRVGCGGACRHCFLCVLPPLW